MPGRGAPSVPARVTEIPIASGRRLRTVRGTLAELEAQAASFGEDYLRVWLREPARAGLRDDTTAVLPNALEVRIDPEFAAGRTHADGRDVSGARSQRRMSCSPNTAPPSRCGTRGWRRCSRELHDEVTAAAGGG